MEPVAEQLQLPEGYGTPTETLRWSDVRKRLVEAEQYWLATTRPDGRPHVVPIDGVWVDDVWYFGGDPHAIHQRNLQHNRQIAVHLPDTIAAVIVEGAAEWRIPSHDEAQRIADGARVKYAKHGYPITAGTYAAGTWGLR
jgi:hypothetical protein